MPASPDRPDTSGAVAQSDAAGLDLRAVFGFGVAGNFAGHLEQAGEAADFVGIGAVGQEAPKGIFPWFVPAPGGSAVVWRDTGDQVEQSKDHGRAEGGAPQDETPAAPGVPAFLATFPISSTQVVRPEGDEINLQIEPEVGLLATVHYGSDGTVESIAPRAIGAFNDCSIRRPGAKKISHKKNWGADSKGLSSTLLPIDDLSPDGPTSTYRLACFLARDGETHAYGQDSALPEYSYYGSQLLDWIVDRLENQAGADDSPLEPVGDYLRAAGNPPTILVGIGATRYTELGESTFLKVGDESIVVVYDGAQSTPDEVAAAVGAGTDADLPSASVLRQQVVAATSGAPLALDL